MTDHAVAVTVLAIMGVVALLATAAIAYFLGRRFKQKSSAVLIAGIAVPITILMAAVYFVATDEVDGPPPGNVLLGSLLVAAILTPITLLTSGIAVRRARRSSIR